MMLTRGWTVATVACASLAVFHGCGTDPTAMLPGDYSGTVRCTSTVEGISGITNDRREFPFTVGLTAAREVLIDGSVPRVGDPFTLVTTGLGSIDLRVREIVILSTAVLIAYDETGVLTDGSVVDGSLSEEFHFTPPAKILYLRQEARLVGSGVDSRSLMEDCDGFLVP